MATSIVGRKPVEIQVSHKAVHLGTAVAYSDTRGYLVEFKNGTQQWVSPQYIREVKNG